MFDNETYNKTLEHLNRNNPKVVSRFRNIAQIFGQYCDLNDSMIRCVERLALAGQYIYLNDNIFTHAIKKNEIIIFSEVLYELLNSDFWHGEKFLSSYPTLQVPLSKIARDLISLSKNSLRNIKKSEQIISYCLTAEDPGHALYLIEMFDTVAQSSPGFVMDFYNIIQTRLLDYPREIFLEWTSRGIDLFTSNRSEEAVAFFKIQSKESKRILNLFHTSLADIRHILNIYCSSLAGRSMNILSTDLSAFAVRTIYTDGKSIFLPPEINFFKRSKLNENMYTALSAHQAAAIKYNTYEFDFSAINFLAALRDKYGRLLPNIMENVKKQYGKIAESIKELPTGEIAVNFPTKRRLLLLETDHEKFFYSFPTPELARDLFNMIENARIENKLSLQYSGLKNDFELLNEYIYKSRPEMKALTGDREEQFFTVLECFIQYVLVKKWKTQIVNPDISKPLDQIINYYNKIFDPESSVQNTAEICFLIYNIFFDNFPVIPISNKNDVHESFSDLNKPEMKPEIILESNPELLKEGTGPGQFNPVGDTKDLEIDLTSSTSKEKKSDDIRNALASGNVRIYQYPEFDYTKSSYVQKYCTLFETKLKTGNNLYYNLIIKKRNQLFKRLKKRFLMLQPEEVELSRHWLDGNEIHLGDAVDFTIDLLRGASPDEKIYYQKNRNIRDIAVAILVDASSSTKEIINTQSIIDIELEALSLLASVLSIIGDSFGIYTFFSTGRQKVVYNILKDFTEPWNSTSQGRITDVNAYAGNRDGCAIRHTMNRISELPNKTKLLLILSDGIPADAGYGSESSGEVTRYGIEDTRRALAECRMSGVVPYCITIDKKAKAYIPHLYGAYNYTIIDDVSLLPERLSKLYLRLTK
jgi:nitric oxide reductase NorD protein